MKMNFKTYFLISEENDSVKNELDLPLLKKEGVIQIVIENKNPIYIQLSNNTKLFLTYEQYRRLNKKPMVGKKMIVWFQRNPDDHSQTTSQVHHCEVV